MPPRLLACLLAVVLAGCAGAPLPECTDAAPAPLEVQVVDHGWHTDLALPADGLTGGLAAFRRLFPGARVLVVGFGRRSFMTAPARSLADYLVGPFPGDGVLLVTALSAAPALAYAEDGTVGTVALTGPERDRLDRFVWASFEQDAQGAPERVGPAPFQGGVFYAARPGYSGLHTCNTWTAEALAAAGLPVAPDGVVFAGETMARVAPIAAGGLCRIADPARPR